MQISLQEKMPDCREKRKKSPDCFLSETDGNNRKFGLNISDKID